MPGGEFEKVTKDNLQSYIDAVLKARFDESRAQIQAIREGIKLVF